MTLNLRWRGQPAASALSDVALAERWNRLNAGRGNLPFLDARAVRAALDTFGDGREELWCGEGAGGIQAMFVLTPQGAFRRGTFQPSQVPLGAWVAEPAHALDDLAASLQQALGTCLVLSVTQVDPRLAPRADDDGRRRHDDYIDTAWLDVVGDFATYWAARGKNLRQNMRKQRNKLAAEGVAARMLVWRDPADMAAALERYGALESAGWKAGGGTAIHASNAQGRFYRRLLEEGARAGEAVVYEYRFDERTVAMNLCLLRDGQLVVLKTAYDESIKALSPAFLLREEELQAFFGGGEVRRIEYYGRVMDWHTKLTDSKRTLYHLTCYRWAWLRQLAERRRAAPAPATPAPAAVPAEAPADVPSA